MQYETTEHIKDTDFKRLTGIQSESFGLMLGVEWAFGDFI
jgi:hypothetical protein